MCANCIHLLSRNEKEFSISKNQIKWYNILKLIKIRAKTKKFQSYSCSSQKNIVYKTRMFSESVKQDTPLSQMNALLAPGGYHTKVNPLSPHSKVHWTTSLPFHCGGTPLWLLLVTRVITICKSESRKSEQIYPGSGLLRQLICLWQLSAAQATARRTLKMRRQHIDRQHKTNVQGRDKKPKDKTENRKTENWTETKRTAAHKEVRSHKKKICRKILGPVWPG